MNDQLPLDQIKVDQDNLYREESITDLRVATIRRLIPIKADGTDDLGRPVQYIGSTQIISQMGPLPISTPSKHLLSGKLWKNFPKPSKMPSTRWSKRQKNTAAKNLPASSFPAQCPAVCPDRAALQVVAVHRAGSFRVDSLQHKSRENTHSRLFR